MRGAEFGHRYEQGGGAIRVDLFLLPPLPPYPFPKVWELAHPSSFGKALKRKIIPVWSYWNLPFLFFLPERRTLYHPLQRFSISFLFPFCLIQGKDSNLSNPPTQPKYKIPPTFSLSLFLLPFVLSFYNKFYKCFN